MEEGADEPLLHHNLDAIGRKIVDGDEETYDLFSHDLPQSNLGMIDDKAAVLQIEVAGHEYEIRQSPSLLNSSHAEGTTGAALWKISPLVAEWMQDETSALWSTGILHSDATVVELGSGATGLIGLVMASRVSKYILTDQKSVMKLLQENINANASVAPKSKRNDRRKTKKVVAGNGSVQALDLNWETDHATALDEAVGLCRKIDLVVICDCVFNDFLLDPLVSMCDEICSKSDKKQTVVLIAQQLRSDQVFSSYMEKLLRKFHVWRISDDCVPISLKNGSGFVLHLGVLR